MNDSEKLFIYNKNELIKSLEDGYDLDRSAAEYMISYMSLDEPPKDNVSLFCKNISEEILAIRKADDDEQQVADEVAEEKSSGASKSAMYLLGLRGIASTSPSNHDWMGRTIGTVNRNLRHAIWPKVATDANSNYQKVSPFDEKFNPLLHLNSITNRREFTEMIRSMFLNSKGEPKSKSHAQNELDWEKHYLKSKNPIILGDKKTSFAGEDEKINYNYSAPITVNGTNIATNHDLYERDFLRWKLDNGHSKIDDNQKLRNQHFEERADDWESDDYIIHNGEEIPTALGWGGYMFGMEWLSPEERVAVWNHLEDKGSVKHNHQKVTMPNGEVFPIGRFVNNAIERMMPEFNYWARSQPIHTPNAHHRRESNENDFINGINRFEQQGLNHLAHMSYDNSDDGNSVASMILDEINRLHPGDGEELIESLPRFKKHINSKIPDKEDFKSLKHAEREHYRRSGRASAHEALLSLEDLYYLSGYHPKTKEHMTDHPIYGNLENPIIPKEKLEEMENEAQIYSGQASSGKKIREALAHKKKIFGPRASKNKLSFWNENEDGYTTGNGAHWWQAHRKSGGVGRNFSTYIEMIHDMLSDENGDSILGGIDDSGNLILNKDTMNIFGHIAPYIAPYNIETQIGADGKSWMKSIPLSLPTEYHINPHDISRVRHDSEGNLLTNGEGSTFKNNITDHLSSIAGKYTNDVLDMSDAERRNLYEGKSLNHHLSTEGFTENPFNTVMKPYGEGPTDRISKKQAILPHLLKTILGRLQYPENPQKKSVHSLNSLKSSGDPFSTGETLDEFLDFIGWSPTVIPTDSRIGEGEILSSMADRDAFNGLQIAMNKLKTKDPHVIAEYLNSGDFSSHGEKSEEQQFLSTLSEELKRNTTKYGEELSGHKDGISTKSIADLLSRGAFQPSMEEEQGLRGQLDDLEQSLAEELEFGRLSEEELSAYRDRIGNIKARITNLEFESRNKQPTKLSNWWKDKVKHTYNKVEADNNAIVDYAKNVLMPKILESQPDAFDPTNKMKFLHNSSQLLRMANIALLTQPASSHNLSTYSYGVSHREKKSLEQLTGHNSHLEIANLLNNKGVEIDGNMSVDKVLRELNLPSTPQHKEHVRNVINQSNKMNTPLKVMTVHNAITNNDAGTIAGVDVSHFADDDYHELLNEAQSGSTVTDWKSHSLHSVPTKIIRELSQQSFGKGLINHGINLIHNKVYDTKGAGIGPKKKRTRTTQNNIDSLLVLNPNAVVESEVPEIPVENEVVATADWSNGRPISPPTPESHASVWDLYNAGRMDDGYPAQPTFGIEHDSGEILVGSHVEPTWLHSIPEDTLSALHGQSVVNQALALPGITPQTSAQQQMSSEGIVPADDPYTVSAGEINNYIQSLLNPDILLIKASKEDWSPPIRPMHRIFELDDIKNLRGFSDSWIVSKWYEGKRVIIIKDDDVLFLNESGKKTGAPKSVKENIPKINDKNFIIDAILNDGELFVIDILEYDDSDVSDMETNERLKILRGQFESHETVLIPGPYNTRVTDEDGLEDAVNELKTDSDKILLRDSKSTYMKGERRHPKWLILREEKELNFIILDRRGNGPYTYRIGAGPILTAEGLGNRAIEVDKKPYMDIGTVQREENAYKIGDIVEAKISGVTKKTRGGRDIFNVQVNSIIGEGSGEGAASTESLSLLTKSFSPIIIPHDINFEDNILKIDIKDIDTIQYKVEKFDNMWYLTNPKCEIGDLTKSRYSYKLCESLSPYWMPIADLLFKGYLTTKLEDSETEEEEEVESAGILGENDKNRILKPEFVKALELAIRSLDIISKEKMTWTGPKGLGIDVGTPHESPRGPTSLRDDSTLPDFDSRPRPGEEPEKPMTANKKGKHRLSHAKLETDAGESIGFDLENDEPILSVE